MRRSSSRGMGLSTPDFRLSTWIDLGGMSKRLGNKGEGYGGRVRSEQVVMMGGVEPSRGTVQEYINEH